MPDFFQNVNGMMEKSNQQLTALFEKMFNATRPEAVFSPPIQAGDYTLITASEVSGGGMYFSGIGGGIGEDKKEEGQQPAQPAGAASQERERPSGGGGGATGGGWSGARPVATIVIGPQGVQVQPVFDITKVSIAFFTALGAMFLMGRRMRHFSRHMMKAMK